MDWKFGGPGFDTSPVLALVSDSGPPNFRSIRLGPKLTLTNPKLTITLN